MRSSQIFHLIDMDILTGIIPLLCLLSCFILYWFCHHCTCTIGNSFIIAWSLIRKELWALGKSINTQKVFYWCCKHSISNSVDLSEVKSWSHDTLEYDWYSKIGIIAQEESCSIVCLHGTLLLHTPTASRYFIAQDVGVRHK